MDKHTSASAAHTRRPLWPCSTWSRSHIPTGNARPAARVPADGSGELRFGSQCVVREGQLAFFARDGRFLDMLIPGRHTLTSANIPLLIDLLKISFGSKSPFRADVYYVNWSSTDMGSGARRSLFLCVICSLAWP